MRLGDRVLTQENTDLISARGDNCVQDVIPCVIENGLIVSELCATQYGVIGTANVVETNLGKYIQLRVTDRRARAKRAGFHLPRKGRVLGAFDVETEMV